MTSNEKQLRIWIKKQKTLALEAKDLVQRDYILMMWHASLSAFWMNGVITHQELNALYAELRDFVIEIGAA